MLKDRIKQARLYRGMTQKEIAGKMGITPPSYNQYETGKRTPKIETLQRIADALDLHLLFIHNEPYFDKVIFDNLKDGETIAQHDAEFRYDQMLDAGSDVGNPTMSDYIKAQRDRINNTLDKLNQDGITEAARQVTIIGMVPDFQK